MDKELELRCFCSRHVLLAICGRDKKDNSPYIHIKSTRNDKVITEAIITKGQVRIRCRECLRWHTITIVMHTVKRIEEKLPVSISID